MICARGVRFPDGVCVCVVCAVIKRHKLNGRNVEVKKAVSKQEIGPGGGGGGGRGGGAPRGGKCLSTCTALHWGGGGFSESEFKSEDPVFDPQREAGVFLNVSSLSGSSGLPV